jgi:hypothetical protein
MWVTDRPTHSQLIHPRDYLEVPRNTKEKITHNAHYLIANCLFIYFSTLACPLKNKGGGNSLLGDWSCTNSISWAREGRLHMDGKAILRLLHIPNIDFIRYSRALERSWAHSRRMRERQWIPLNFALCSTI